MKNKKRLLYVFVVISALAFFSFIIEESFCPLTFFTDESMIACYKDGIKSFGKSIIVSIYLGIPLTIVWYFILKWIDEYKESRKNKK